MKTKSASLDTIKEVSLQSSGMGPSISIADTSTHTGDWAHMQVWIDASIAQISIAGIDRPEFIGATLPVGFVAYNVTQITLAGGAVELFKNIVK